jgi:hypothetical protein
MPDMETPEADAAEQEQTVTRADLDPDAAVGTPREDASLEVDEGDLAESTREVPLDDDDWR